MQERNGMSCSEAGKLGYLASKSVLKEIHEGIIKEYYLNPSYCVECGCVLPYEKRHNKFVQSIFLSIFAGSDLRVERPDYKIHYFTNF